MREHSVKVRTFLAKSSRLTVVIGLTYESRTHRHNFVCGDSHHHFQRWWWQVTIFFQSRICNFSIVFLSLGKRIVFFLLPEAFCGLKHAENAIAAGAPPLT